MPSAPEAWAVWNKSGPECLCLASSWTGQGRPCPKSFSNALPSMQDVLPGSGYKDKHGRGIKQPRCSLTHDNIPDVWKCPFHWHSFSCVSVKPIYLPGEVSAWNSLSFALWFAQVIFCFMLLQKLSKQVYSGSNSACYSFVSVQITGLHWLSHFRIGLRVHWHSSMHVYSEDGPTSRILKRAVLDRSL